MTTPSLSAAAPAMPAAVIQRDGQRAVFDACRIRSAIARAGAATGEFGDTQAALLADEACRVLAYRWPGGAPHIEQIQDVVEQTLVAARHMATARAYMAYRQRRATLRADAQTLVDVQSSINEDLTRADWRVNANQGYSLDGPILNVAGKVEAAPPKHMSSAVGQIVNFLGTLQNEWAGAQAFSSFDTYMAPFVRKDGMDYAAVRQCMQEMIYNLNVPSRWGTQTPFTNLTFDWVCPEDLREQVPVIGGEEMPFAYGDLQAEMDLINRAYIDVMTTGDAKGRVFTFPIPTYNITPDFPWESENAGRLFAMTAKYGLPYFQNFINSELKPNMVRSMCCRLQLDLRELLKRGNGLFGSAEQTGSVGVVTVNCARLGYLHAGDEAALLDALGRLLELGSQSLEVKRKLIQRLMDQGLFPYTRRYLGTLRNHFSTLGVNGINEMVRNFTRGEQDITTAWGHAFALRLLDFVRKRITGFQERTGHLYNLEASPAEGATYRFAKEDLKRWPDILHAGTPGKPYYTNSSQLPVGFTDDPFEALARQEDLQTKYTGGTVLHLYMGERISDAAACRELVRRALTRFRLPYITVTPTFSVCPVHGYLAGEHPYCPLCDAEKLAAKRQAIERQQQARAA